MMVIMITVMVVMVAVACVVHRLEDVDDWS